MTAPSSGLFDWRLRDLIPDLKDLPPESARPGTLAVYRYNDQDYIIKSRFDPKVAQRELNFLKAAADISVHIKGYVRRSEPDNKIIGFVMPRLRTVGTCTTVPRR